MKARSLVLLAATAATAAAVVVSTSAPALAGGAPLSATLTGANEVPGPGDPDGSGSAAITVNPGQQEVCWSIDTANLGEFTGAHIHRGTADVAGPVVVHLDPAAPGCRTADRDLLVEILRDPSAFYVNVHTTEFRAGAVRGQLTRG